MPRTLNLQAKFYGFVALPHINGQHIESFPGFGEEP